MVSGRQYAVAVEGAVITFECKRAGHLYKIDFSKKPLHRRMGEGACKMMASWWTKEKGGCIGDCPSCERAHKREVKAQAEAEAKARAEAKAQIEARAKERGSSSS